MQQHMFRHLLVWGVSVRSNFPVFPITGGFKCYLRRAADTDPWGIGPLFVPHPGCRARNSSAFSLTWLAMGLHPQQWGGAFPRIRTSRDITDEWFAKPELIPLHFSLLKFKHLVQVNCLSCLWDQWTDPCPCKTLPFLWQALLYSTGKKIKLKILKLQKIIKSLTFRIQLLGISLILLRSLYQTTLKMPSIWAGIRSLRAHQLNSLLPLSLNCIPHKKKTRRCHNQRCWNKHQIIMC